MEGRQGASLLATPTLTLWYVYKIPETPHWINPHISFTETWSVGEERPYMGRAATGPQPQALKQAVAMEVRLKAQEPQLKRTWPHF